MADRPRALVRRRSPRAGVELLRARFDVDEDPRGELAAIIGRYDGIVIRSATKLTADLIERRHEPQGDRPAPAWGVDNVDVEAATRRGIVVANAPESNIVSAAENHRRRSSPLPATSPRRTCALVEGRWERSKWGGIELAEKTLGVLGFGRIGQQVARRALGLQMNVVAYDPFVVGRALPRAGRRAATRSTASSRAPTS